MHLKKVRDEIAALKASVSQKVQVWFEDEARFGQQGCLTRVWGRRGSRPTAVRQTQYDYLWVMGATCPDNGQSYGLLMPHLDTEAVNLFLDLFSKSLDCDVIAVLIWDQAGFHTSRGIVVPANIRLIALPPY